MGERVRHTIEQAVEKALRLPTEAERICNLIDLCRGYGNPYNSQDEKTQREVWFECKEGLTSQRGKLKRLIREAFAVEQNGID